MAEIGDCGFLKISNEQDRMTVAAILYKNGYTPTPVRRRKNGKTYEYLVGYELRSPDLEETQNES